MTSFPVRCNEISSSRRFKASYLIIDGSFIIVYSRAGGCTSPLPHLNRQSSNIRFIYHWILFKFEFEAFVMIRYTNILCTIPQEASKNCLNSFTYRQILFKFKMSSFEIIRYEECIRYKPLGGFISHSSSSQKGKIAITIFLYQFARIQNFTYYTLKVYK